MLKRIPLENREEWRRLLLQSPESLEEGFRIIDTGLQIPGGSTPDLVGISTEGELVFVTLRSPEGEDAVLAALDQAEWAEKNRGILNRLYGEKGFIPSSGIRVAVVAETFSSGEMRRAPLLSSIPMELIKVHILEWKGDKGLYLERLVSRRRIAPGVHPSPSLPVSHRPFSAEDEPISSGLYKKAREEILSISEEIEEKVSGDETHFLFKGEFLAILRKGVHSVSIGLLSPREGKEQEIYNDMDLEPMINKILRKFFALCAKSKGGKRNKKMPTKVEKLSDDELSELNRPP